MLANYATGLANVQVCSSQIKYIYPQLWMLRLLQFLPAAQTAPLHFPANADTTVHSASNEYTNSNRITTLTEPLAPSPTNIIHTLVAMIEQELMPSPKQLWRRAAAAVKDKQALCLTRVLASRSRSGQRNPDMEAAIIRATSHDELTLDYTNARRVFTWARTHPVMWALSRRASRTRSWAVALKSLLLTHGLLISCDSGPLGRLPFDLSDFRDRSSSSKGYSSFVQAYFNFLDHRSILLGDGDDDDDCGLERVENLQTLLELLMQIRPYADGMNVGLILEAMDCVVVEIFGVYSCICRGIAAFLVGYTEDGKRVEMRRKGLLGIRILKRAVIQSEQLSSYFEMCKGMGVGKAVGLPPVERVPEEDIRDLERLVMTENESKEIEGKQRSTVVIVTENWVVFDGETKASNDKGCLTRTLAGTTESKSLTSIVQVGNLIEL